MKTPKAADPILLGKKPTLSTGAIGKAAAIESGSDVGTAKETPDAFGGDGPPSDVKLAQKKPGAVNALLQLIGLRGKNKEPPKTQGAAQAVFGAALDASRKRGPGKLKIAVIATCLLLGAGHLNELGAQSVYVNVNGAKVTSAEYQGAKRAAQNIGETFTAVKPAELGSILEAANAANGKLRKLVVSGHSSGLWVSGSDAQGSYSLSHDDMTKHAAAFPQAFAKVKLFFGMACNIGTEENSRQWMQLFPNLNALVGFDNIGPASDRPAAGSVLQLVDAELQKVDFKTLTRAGALQLAKRVSNLPGVNVTEFAIRIKANDGTTVFFSKKNPPTSLSSAQDVVGQHRLTGFTPWFEATDARFANPPADHSVRNPIRVFYNASQTLLNSMGRDLTARGQDPAQDHGYQQVSGEKEAALRLIYFDVVKQNAEFHKRPLINTVLQELADHGVQIAIPKLTTLTRAQIVEVNKQLQEVGNYTLTGFANKVTADLNTVNLHLQGKSESPINLDEVGPKTYDWQRDQLVTQLEIVVKDEAAPVPVKEAAQRIVDGLKKAPSEAFLELQKLFEDGLVKLKIDAFPPDWVTTERPNV